MIPDAATRPRQRLAAYLLELLSDEWIVVPAFWQRWFFSEDGREPSHRAFNEQQWGAILAAGAEGAARRAGGAQFFELAFGISQSRSDPRGVYAGLVHLGCDASMERAWQASQHRLLGLLETHFAKHDYLLGGRPSLADFALLGPLYAHLYRDAVPGFALRVFFPLVCEWVERTNGEGALNARSYGQKLYALDDSGALVGRIANSDGGEWLADDEIPQTLLPILQVFFDEMWPCLATAAETLTAYIASDAHEAGAELPGKTFTATPGFEAQQTGEGALTHEFALGGERGRRMVVPYQMWMLQRIEGAMAPCMEDAVTRRAVDDFVLRLDGSEGWASLGAHLEGCRLRKEGARLFSL